MAKTFMDWLNGGRQLASDMLGVSNYHAGFNDMTHGDILGGLARIGRGVGDTALTASAFIPYADALTAPANASRLARLGYGAARLGSNVSGAGKLGLTYRTATGISNDPSIGRASTSGTTPTPFQALQNSQAYQTMNPTLQQQTLKQAEQNYNNSANVPSLLQNNGNIQTSTMPAGLSINPMATSTNNNPVPPTTPSNQYQTVAQAQAQNPNNPYAGYGAYSHNNPVAIAAANGKSVGINAEENAREATAKQNNQLSQYYGALDAAQHQNMLQNQLTAKDQYRQLLAQLDLSNQQSKNADTFTKLATNRAVTGGNADIGQIAANAGMADTGVVSLGQRGLANQGAYSNALTDQQYGNTLATNKLQGQLAAGTLNDTLASLAKQYSILQNQNMVDRFNNTTLNNGQLPTVNTGK
jgi:hypothetical protein